MVAVEPEPFSRTLNGCLSGEISGFLFCSVAQTEIVSNKAASESVQGASAFHQLPRHVKCAMKGIFTCNNKVQNTIFRCEKVDSNACEVAKGSCVVILAY